MERSNDEFRRLEGVIRTLRAPGGCPWDREQTLPDICHHLMEEAAEVADAVSNAGGDSSPEVCEELGDVLTNVLLATSIAEENGSFSFDDVARAVREKLVRRHPHVFGDRKAANAEDALSRWESVKRKEKPDRPSEGFRSRLADLPRSLPPLARAHKMSARAARYGFDWPAAAGSLEKLREEVAEVEELLRARGFLDAGGDLAEPGAGNGGEEPSGDVAAGEEPGGRPGPRARLEEELGDVLFAVVNLCRKLGVHPDDALRATLRKFTERFEHMERRIPDLEAASLEEMDEVWNEMRHRPPDPRRGDR